MSLPREALIEDENGWLRLGSAALVVRDLENVPVNCVETERDPATSAWPVFGIRCGEQWLLGFVGRANVTQPAVWQLNESGRCLAKHAPDPAIMRLLLACAGCTTALDAVAVRGPSGPVRPAWLTESLAMQVAQSAPAAPPTLRPSGEAPDWLLGFLQPHLARLNADIQGLVAWLETSPSIAREADAILRVWQGLCGQFLGRLRTSTAFFDALRNQAGYQLLREVAAAFIGRHLLRCPFTGEYQFARQARHIIHTGPHGGVTGGARILRYEPVPGLWFHEIRGHGFLAQTDALITGEGLLFQPAPEHAWSSWLTPAACARYPALAPALVENQAADSTREVIVLNTSAGPNLGHLLWNDCSGLAGVLAFTGAMPAQDFVCRWRLALAPSRDLRFARDSHEDFIRRVLTRLASTAANASGALHPGPNAFQYFESDAALSACLESPETISISLKSLVVSSEFAACFRAEAEQVSLPESLSSLAAPTASALRVFVNVRLHDKALLNISECLVAAVERARECGWNPHEILFVLEGHEEAGEKLAELSHVLAACGARAMLALGLGIDVLGAILAHCEVAIAPIGSGAVLPTWIYDLPTFLHADRAHMPQAGFWAHVGGSPDNLVVIDTAHIQDVEDRLYSSYTIAPVVFADCFDRLLKRWQAVNA